MAARRRQLVLTKIERRSVILWMINLVKESGSDHQIAAAAVNEFPKIFPNKHNLSNVRDSNRKKALRWWKGRDTFFRKLSSPLDGRVSVTSSKAVNKILR